MDLPHVHKLGKPLQHGSETIQELRFEREPVAGDLRDIRLTEIDKADNMILLIARLAAIPPAVAKQLGMADFMACGEVISGFLPAGRRTGSAAAD